MPVIWELQQQSEARWDDLVCPKMLCRKLVHACADGTKANALASATIAARWSAPRQRSRKRSLLGFMVLTSVGAHDVWPLRPMSAGECAPQAG
jgi:hypothetical protein